jgi:GSH-dependent disulfide-bond oxidoreductase
VIELYYWTTPNSHKVLIFLEETGIPYQIRPINISAGEQFSPGFLAINPNNRVPAIVDHAPSDGGPPLSIFESGAILQYFAGKSGRFSGDSQRERTAVSQWLMWQMSGLGPMAGQNHHFTHYAPERIAYATRRYIDETNRLYGVLNRQLARSRFVAGDYSIADMACYPWIRLHERQAQSLDDFPHIKRWYGALSERPAIMRTYEIAASINTRPTVTEEGKSILFGQTSQTGRAAQ